MLLLVKIIFTLAVFIGLNSLVDCIVDKGTKAKENIGFIGGLMVLALIILVAILVIWVIWGGVQI